ELTQQDNDKFKILLLRLTISCRWAFYWVNKLEAKELFEFLNPHLKLPEHWTLSRKVLDAAVAEENKAMYDALCKDKIDVTLTFDRWTNVNNEQLLG
ncbi:10068_t:CDS:1, partial [Racocetra persica]